MGGLCAISDLVVRMDIEDNGLFFYTATRIAAGFAYTNLI